MSNAKINCISSNYGCVSIFLCGIKKFLWSSFKKKVSSMALSLSMRLSINKTQNIFNKFYMQHGSCLVELDLYFYIIKVLLKNYP